MGPGLPHSIAPPRPSEQGTQKERPLSVLASPIPSLCSLLPCFPLKNFIISLVSFHAVAGEGARQDALTWPGDLVVIFRGGEAENLVGCMGPPSLFWFSWWFFSGQRSESVGCMGSREAALPRAPLVTSAVSSHIQMTGVVGRVCDQK